MSKLKKIGKTMEMLGTGLSGFSAPFLGDMQWGARYQAQLQAQANAEAEQAFRQWQMQNANQELAQEAPLKEAQAKYYEMMASGNGFPVYTVNPVTGEMGQAMTSGGTPAFVPKGAKVVSSPVQIPTSEAGRYTLANESVKNIEDVKNILFPDGTPKSFRKDLAIKGQFARWGLAAPTDKDGQRLYRKLSSALSGRQLIQTGVAARPEETNLLYKQFYGNALSNPDSLFEGLNQLKDFYTNYQGIVSQKGDSGNNKSWDHKNVFEGL